MMSMLATSRHQPAGFQCSISISLQGVSAVLSTGPLLAGPSACILLSRVELQSI